MQDLPYTYITKNELETKTDFEINEIFKKFQYRMQWHNEDAYEHAEKIYYK